MGESAQRMVGRYALCDAIASGGMATIHLGRLAGPAGFSRTVAIKRLHDALSKDAGIVAMLLDEARLAGRIRHPNVVPVLDLVTEGDEVFVVMEYVHGEALSSILRLLAQKAERLPVGIAVALVVDALHGLHAAHEATSERGEPLGIVHRDVSPHNILIGVDGVARVTDFGVAKAAGRLQDTRTGEVKGKLAYMAPEQLRREPLDRRVDVYAAGVVLWESLTGSRLFASDSEGATIAAVLFDEVKAPSALNHDVSAELDAIVLRALSREPGARFATAHELAVALEDALERPREHEVGAWVQALIGERLSARQQRVADVESKTMEVSVRTVTSKLEEPRPPQSHVPLAIALALVLGLGGFAIVRSSAPTAALPPPPPAPIASEEAPNVASDAASNVASVSGVPPTIPPSSSVASAHPSASARLPLAVAPPANVGPRPGPTSPPSATTSVSATAVTTNPCDPPFIVDDAGIKIPKRACMGQ